jgi:carbon-monoxide dehydrogenase large subunit
MWEHGGIRVHPTGKVTAFTGSHSHGQGHETTMAQIVADKLGIEVADVDVVHGDTDLVTQGMGTYGSRSAAVGGEALSNAAKTIRKKLVTLAAHLMEVSEEDLVYDDENASVHVKGVPDKSKAFGELAFAAYSGHSLPEGMDPGLETAAYYNPENFTFPSSAHLVQVEIDKDTGEIEIQKYFAVEDCGNVINPMVVEGQILGGIAQGVGQALYEHGIYDDDGQLVTGSMLDYTMPRADNFPMIESDRIETPSPSNTLGVKGVGEMGSITSPPAVVNAVVDALSDYGVKDIEMPLNSEKIWNLIQTNGG